MFDGFGAMMFGAPVRPFDLQFRCFSAAFYEGADTKKINELNHGGKILLPPSALDLLVRLNIEYPMMFKVQSLSDSACSTHCGVLEFLAEEGRCYLPSWMMRQLHLNEGECVRITYATLPKATYTKLKPQSTDFLTISNPRAVLEVELRKFACLTKGDIIAVEYNDQILEFLVMEVKPGRAVSIIECDMNVEFDAPEGYVEPSANATSSSNAAPLSISSASTMDVGGMKGGGGFKAFCGTGHRLDGKSKSSTTSLTEMEAAERSLPQLTVNVNYIPGKLEFVRYDYKCRSLMEKELAEAAKGKKSGGALPFEGGGHVLRATRR
ncbi:ubiquitin fusion degradation protein UFD1 [Onchocerca flexuosa]|uniref:Ubiquitin fusion degradation protein UFD1 n=1 Tax=Onchocerca flexuosa TaxID=387005 RepID=A0A238BRK4_9BILA|nr:ubiquitin fusion degradation protein UFD1 [Onchocerca flexuosa]